MYTKDCFLTELRIKDVCIITVARSSIIAFINCEKKTQTFSSVPLTFSIDEQPRLITLRFLSTNKPFVDTQSVL